MTYEFVNQKNSKSLASRAKKASSYAQRLLGLMGKKDLPQGEGLWFPKCNSIHMWFMKIPIDAVFIKKEGNDYRVIKCFSRLKPWRVFPAMSLNATDVIELPVGVIDSAEVREGDLLCINSK
ncbi:MAG: DUF192 domain-containing protein [Xanthomonadaceae bacterium]|nr:DUF192 domain-containing protein [Xanthomonadaceae bacterium]